MRKRTFPTTVWFILIIWMILAQPSFAPSAYAGKPENPGKSEQSNGKNNDKSGDSSGEEENEESDDEDSSGDEEPTKGNSIKVVLKLEQSLNGDLMFEVDAKGVPLGTYELHVAGANRGNIQFSEEGSHTRGRIRFRTNPVKSTEILLDFEVKGALVEIIQNGETFYSGTAPTSAEIVDNEGDENEDEADVKTNIEASEEAPENSSMTLKLEQDEGGELELKIEFIGLPANDYGLYFDDILRAAITVTGDENGKKIFVKFVGQPSNTREYLLNFEIIGSMVQLRLGEVILFEGVILVPVDSPVTLNHEESEWESITNPLLPDPDAEQLNDGLKHSSWLGYYEDSSFPLIQQCVLGQMEYRYDSSRNLLVSENFGVLEIVRNRDDASIAFYSFSTGQYLKVSETTADCTLLEPSAIYDSEGEIYQESVVPEPDNEEAFYDLAFKATQKTQVRSSQVIQLIQAGNRTAARTKLTEAEFYRNLAVHNANKTIQAAQITGEAVKFWTDAANHLINTVDSALIAAQNAYLGI